jgi:hypothetical protein
MKYWEIIADNLSKAGWSYGCVSAVDFNGRTIFVADAHRDGNQRFVVRADERLTAFVELESVIRARENCLDEPSRFSRNSTSLNGFESGGGHFPARFFVSSGPAIPRINSAGKKKKGRPHESTDSA